MSRFLGIFLFLLASLAAAETASDPLDQATQALIEFSFEAPIKTFRAVRTTSVEGDDRWQRATYGLAVCLQQLSPVRAENIAEADRLYQELADKAPTSRFAPRSVLNRGRIAELIDYYKDPVDLPAARAHYQQVAEQWSNLPIAGEATLRLAGSWIQTNHDESVIEGIRVLTTWLAAHPDDPLASAMWHYLGDTHFLQRKDYRAAMDAYVTADTLGLIWRGRESIVWWRMARMAELHLDDPQAAIRYYTRICVDAQTSGRAFEAQIALARLGAPIPELSAFKAYPGTRPPLPGENVGAQP